MASDNFIKELVDGEIAFLDTCRKGNGRPRKSWEETALRLAFNIADYRSEDPYVQCGAVLIKNDNSILIGYNGPPANTEIDWSNRDERRERVIHAEENVLTWIKPGEAKLLAVTALPCKICMKTIAHKNIKTVVYRDELDGYDNEFSKKLAKEFGVELKRLSIITQII